MSNVRIGNKQFYYDIILVCKNGPYVRVWKYLKERLDLQAPEIIKNTLDILQGRATRIIDWLIELQEKVASLEEKRDKKWMQKSLENYI